MLVLRPTCENCNVELPTDSNEAMICSYECTFCKSCVDTVLKNVCPNCGGGFSPRPIRPKNKWRKGLSIAQQPPGTRVVCKPVDIDEHQGFSAAIKNISPEER